MDNNQRWYRTKEYLERVLGDLWLGFLLAMCGLLVISLCVVVVSVCYVLARML